MPVVAKRLYEFMDQVPLGREIGLGPWSHCVRWGPSFPAPKGHSPRNFRPMPIVAERSQLNQLPLTVLSIILGVGPTGFGTVRYFVVPIYRNRKQDVDECLLLLSPRLFIYLNRYISPILFSERKS